MPLVLKDGSLKLRCCCIICKNCQGIGTTATLEDGTYSYAKQDRCKGCQGVGITHQCSRCMNHDIKLINEARDERDFHHSILCEVLKRIPGELVYDKMIGLGFSPKRANMISKVYIGVGYPIEEELKYREEIDMEPLDLRLQYKKD